MQPTAQTGIVWKISAGLFILLAVVLYKLNDYFKQEKWQLAQAQLRTQIVSTKTSVSSQISNLKNVLSSYEYELNEAKINWVQLDPFFAIARGEAGRVQQLIVRSGSIAEKWTADYLEKALAVRPAHSDQPIKVQLFQDKAGTKFMTFRFTNRAGRSLIVVGGADYFQKYFDLDRGGRITSLLQTTDHVLAAHTEADYLATSIDESALSTKKFLIEKEEIPGTNLIAMNLMSRRTLNAGFAVPWSVVGLLFGSGLLIIAILIYTIDPLDKRIEKYRMQEREQIFKDTVTESLAENLTVTPEPLISAPVEAPEFSKSAVWKATVEDVEVPEEPEVVQVPPPPPPVPGAKPVFRPFSETPPVVVTLHDEIMSDENTITRLQDELKLEETNALPAEEEDAVDLDQALSLDEIESDEVTQKGVQFIQDQMQPQKINLNTHLPSIEKPAFKIKRKDFKVDQIQVAIRRPEKL